MLGLVPERHQISRIGRAGKAESEEGGGKQAHKVILRDLVRVPVTWRIAWPMFPREQGQTFSACSGQITCRSRDGLIAAPGRVTTGC